MPIQPLSPSEQKSQRLRINRSKAAFSASILLLAWLSIGFSFGYVTGTALVISAAWVTCISTLVFWLQTTNRNLKFTDPSFTQPLILSAVACVLGNAIFLDATSSAVIFIWILMAASFSIVTGTPRSIILMTYWICVAISITGYLQYMLQSERSGGVILWQGSAFLGTLISMAAFGVWSHKNKTRNRRRQMLADLTISSMTDAVLNLDANGLIVSVNPAALKLFDLEKNSLEGKNLEEVLRPALAVANDKQASNLIQNCRSREERRVRGRISNAAQVAEAMKVSFEMNTKLERYKSKRRIEVTANPVNDAQEVNAGLLLIFKDVTEQFNLMQQLAFDSTHDAMTGLLNRRGFEVKLNELVAQLNTQNEGSFFTVAILDLDNLKIVNDTCGHRAGDDLIEKASEAIRQQLRPTDTVARYGGDEFAFIFSDATPEQTKDICDRLIASLKELNFQWDNKPFKTGASMGCITVSNEDFDAEECLSKADSALYLAKELGKGRVQFHNVDDSKTSSKHAALEWAWKINQAIEENQFKLHAQRIVSFDDKHEDHFEILIRLSTTDHGILTPVNFLPAAERFHLMPSIDRWVIENSLKALNKFHSESGKYPKIAINLSAQSLADIDFLDFVITEISASNVPPQFLCFELTETVAIASISEVRHFIEQIKSLGCEFQLDDVGAGFNSFSHLRELTFDAIKIDGHFVKNMLTVDANRGIVESLSYAAESIGLYTIAEMIEDERTARALLDMGIKHLQGYYFHKPEPIEKAFAGPPPSSKTNLQMQSTLSS